MNVLIKEKMKITLLLFVIGFFPTIIFSQNGKVLFLAHSTGTNLYIEGNVSEWIANYNSNNSTDYQINIRDYPDTPWPWDNYPYDYWKLWVNNSCNNDNPNIECLQSIARNYDLIIFKHCYSGAGIIADSGKPNVDSSTKTLENYKLQYRALRNLFDSMPEKKFMVWTLVPLHRLSTTKESAERAFEFVEWVKSQWLIEDGKPHPNIFIFDFFSLAAEMNENPINGQQYCLKYDYERRHTNDSFHPNLIANETIGPLFAQAVINSLSKNHISKINITTQNGETAINLNHGKLQMIANITPSSASNKPISWSVISDSGNATIDSNGLLTAEKDGKVRVLASAMDGSGVVGELLIEISNQTILISNLQISSEINNDGYRIYPNPTSDNFNIQIDQVPPMGVRFELVNSIGQILIQQTIFESLSKWSFAEYDGNLFIVIFSVNRKIIAQKIIRK